MIYKLCLNLKTFKKYVADKGCILDIVKSPFCLSFLVAKVIKEDAISCILIEGNRSLNSSIYWNKYCIGG